MTFPLIKPAHTLVRGQRVMLEHEGVTYLGVIDQILNRPQSTVIHFSDRHFVSVSRSHKVTVLKAKEEPDQSA